MRRLRQLFRRRTDKRDVEPKEDPPLPWLPSSTTHDATTWSPTRQTQGFFALPYDIRHQILKEAFGGRAIHIDLRLRLPDHTLESSGGRGPRHGGYPPLINWNKPPKYSPLTRGENMAWRWYHCVCHRDPPGRTAPELVSRAECLEGQACCEGDTWTFDSCQLGAMGFLLSCKQAHEELLDVLYGSNTIFMKSMPLIEAMCSERSPAARRLLGPGAEAITSLQLRLDLTLFLPERPGDISKENHDRSRLNLLLKGIAAEFPHLAKLELIFDRNVYLAGLVPFNNMDAVEKHLLNPLLAASKRMGSVDMSISIPDTVYDAVLIGLQIQHTDTAGETTFEMKNLWMRYPFADNWDARSPGQGYWIKVGVVNDRGWHVDGTFYLSVGNVCRLGT